MSVEAFEGAKTVRKQFFKDLEALLLEGTIVEEPWTVNVPAIPERNVPASIISGVCHTLVDGGHNVSKNKAPQYCYTIEGRRCRPAAGRMPFIVGTKRQIELFNAKGSVVSLLCGEKFCLNTNHMVLEPKITNCSRSSCSGPTILCAHEPPCLIPGRHFRTTRHGPFEKVFERQHPATHQEAAEEDEVVHEIEDEDSAESVDEEGDNDNGSQWVAVEDESSAESQSAVNHSFVDDDDDDNWSFTYFPEDNVTFSPPPREVIKHEPDEEDKVSTRIQKAEADLERAQKIGNVELELEYSRILRLLLEREKEERSTPEKGTTDGHKLYRVKREDLGEGDEQSKELSPKPSGSGHEMVLHTHYNFRFDDKNAITNDKLPVPIKSEGGKCHRALVEEKKGNEEKEQQANKRARKQRF